jgi:hypothetical protein
MEKVHFNKRVLSHYETDDLVVIRTSDGKEHHGHILVGADGAYSGVRQSLFEKLEKEHRLPRSDKDSLKASVVCLVGQTRPLDPTIHPALEERNTRFDTVIGDTGPYFVRPTWKGKEKEERAKGGLCVHSFLTWKKPHSITWIVSLVGHIHDSGQNHLLDDSHGTGSGLVQGTQWLPKLGMGTGSSREHGKTSAGFPNPLWRVQNNGTVDRSNTQGTHVQSHVGGKVVQNLALWSHSPAWRRYVSTLLPLFSQTQNRN